MKKIGVLGCGWLGLPLAKALLQKGYAIKGSTTHLEKIDVLYKEGIMPFLLSINEQEIMGDIALFFEDCEIVIITIPPKLRSDKKENYVRKIALLQAMFAKHNIKKVLFLSSVSVYSNSNGIKTELKEPNPENESGKQIVAAENILKTDPNISVTVLRLGGLMGPNRHPIYSLSGKKDIENPNAVVNLIHLEDCVEIIIQLIEQDIWGETFNAVMPYYPTRKDYYTKKALELDLPVPEFDESKASVGKIVSSEKLMKRLGYQFKNLG